MWSIMAMMDVMENGTSGSKAKGLMIILWIRKGLT